MAIISKLEEVMKRKGYTLAELAEKVGITTVNLSNIKNGNILTKKEHLTNNASFESFNNYLNNLLYNDYKRKGVEI